MHTTVEGVNSERSTRKRLIIPVKVTETIHPPLFLIASRLLTKRRRSESILVTTHNIMRKMKRKGSLFL